MTVCAVARKTVACHVLFLVAHPPQSCVDGVVV